MWYIKKENMCGIIKIESVFMYTQFPSFSFFMIYLFIIFPSFFFQIEKRIGTFLELDLYIMERNWPKYYV